MLHMLSGCWGLVSSLMSRTAVTRRPAGDATWRSLLSHGALCSEFEVCATQTNQKNAVCQLEHATPAFSSQLIRGRATAAHRALPMWGQVTWLPL